MAETKERMQRLRAKRKDQGQKQAEVWLDAAARERIERLQQPGESLSHLLDRALAALEQQDTQAHGRTTYRIVTTESPPSPPWTYQSGTREEVSDRAQSVTGGVSSDATNPLQRKAALLARLRELKAQGLSLQAIANQLNQEGLPTISGKGTWQKGTIGNLLAQVEEER
jgi:Recombinase